MACPNCGAPGGGPAGCGSCGLGRDPNVGKAFNTGPRSSGGGGSGGNTDCFPGDALILTRTGWKRIDSFNKHDEVLSLAENGHISIAKVKRVVKHRLHPVLKVCSQMDDMSFHVTRRHPILTQRGWVRAHKLRRGDELLHIGENSLRIRHMVKSVERTNRVESVFNLIVDGNHTYLVHGCVAHSFVYLRMLRCWVAKLRAAVNLRFLRLRSNELRNPSLISE